ncbi:hypothetical protein COO60DRAFT_1593870 [Scenedesmus sp. NREL 46B-D3]|nr:hypothetical protein COO60DRAFT_1593870 [Scenedesmus sp. NREL 46B-D3]
MDRLSHARLLVECNRLDDAAALLSVRATGINSSADAKLLLAQLAYKQGNALDAALQLQPDYADALWQPWLPRPWDALQEAAHVCSQQRRAAVQAAPPPPRQYSRIMRGASCCSGGKGSTSDRGVGQHELYHALGLGSGASREDVRCAYKQLAPKLHPDKQAQGASQADRAAAEERFKVVSAAYQALMG